MPENLENKLNENKERKKIEPDFGDRLQCVIIPGMIYGLGGSLIGAALGGQTGVLVGCGLGYITGVVIGHQMMNEYGVKRRVKYEDQLE